MYLKKLCSIIGCPAADSRVRDILNEYEFIRSEIGEDREHVTYLTVRPQGIQIRCDSEDIIRTAFLYGEFRDGFSPFTGEIAPGISVKSDRSDIRRSLGEPLESGSYSAGFLSTGEGAWDQYSIDETQVHLEYSEKDGHIELITFFRKTR